MLKNRFAFTLLEMIFVVVIIGILSLIAISSHVRDLREESSLSVLNAIRYTQQLALQDSKVDPLNSKWQRKLWHIRFSRYNSGAQWFYTVSSSRDMDANVDKNEAATDPTNGKLFYNLGGDENIDSDESPNIFLGKHFSINSVDFSGCKGYTGASKKLNSSTHVAFDQLGRPHKGIYGVKNRYSSVMHKDCKIKFGFYDSSIDDFTIVIKKETGYAFIE